MNLSEGVLLVHPEGELKTTEQGTVGFPLAGPLLVDTEGGLKGGDRRCGAVEPTRAMAKHFEASFCEIP
jgi:hypothetical protein